MNTLSCRWWRKDSDAIESPSMEGLRRQDTRTAVSTFSTMILEDFRTLYWVMSVLSSRFMLILTGLVKPVRAVAFSPAVKLLAAAGDARFVALYDVASGEQIAILSGHQSWIFSLDWSYTGEFLLTGYVEQSSRLPPLFTSRRSYDGKAKVWSIDRRECVATHSETEKILWSVKWLPKVGKGEGFATAGANRSICFYREAIGG